MALTTNEKIIIQSFGLQAVQTGLYKGVIDALGPSIPDAPVGTSQLGTPVWDNLIIKGGSYVDTINGPTTYNDMRIDSCLITLQQVHNVIATPIQGRDGEVLEYISKMSYRINVKGGIFGRGNVRPVSDLINFMLMLQSNNTLVVKSCKFLDEWNISEFAILDKNLPQVAGGYNFQLFEFNAIQDTPVILAQQQNA